MTISLAMWLPTFYKLTYLSKQSPQTTALAVIKAGHGGSLLVYHTAEGDRSALRKGGGHRGTQHVERNLNSSA